MPSYDDWNKLDDEEEEELQDFSAFDGKKDTILFCIDASESMHTLTPNAAYDDGRQTCHLFAALEAAVQIHKRKIVSGPSDSVGIFLFNTTRQTATSRNQGAELKKNTYLFQPIGPLSPDSIQKVIRVLDNFIEDPSTLRSAFPPTPGTQIPMGDVFTSCNWVFRDGAPKTATKRVFLITNQDDPHPPPGNRQLIRSARTTLTDLTVSGVTVEPFFISTPANPFNMSKFYMSVLLPNNLVDEADIDPRDPSVLPESISITRIDDLLAQMRFHEAPKRCLFSIPLKLADGFQIGVKGYALVTEQKKGPFKYFVDLGDRMEVANLRTVYVDEVHESEVEKKKVLYGMGFDSPTAGENSADEGEDFEAGERRVKRGSRPFYTADEVRTFRTMGLEPSIKLLGFKDLSELAFEDNIKHALFLHPDETAYSGSRRTFTALLKATLSKKKMGLALALMRRNSSPVFCALIPQEEKVDESGWRDPAGFHLIPLPFADDIRAAPIEKGARAPNLLKEAARAWIDKLTIKNGTYPPDSYPNPALAFHNAQLEAVAFREEFDPDEFEDFTLPNLEMIHKRAGKLTQAWKKALADDPSSDYVQEYGTKSRKRVLFGEGPDKMLANKKIRADTTVDEMEIQSMYNAGTLGKLRADQLKEFLKSKSQPVSGRKAELVERVALWLDAH